MTKHAETRPTPMIVVWALGLCMVVLGVIIFHVVKAAMANPVHAITIVGALLAILVVPYVIGRVFLEVVG